MLTKEMIRKNLIDVIDQENAIFAEMDEEDLAVCKDYSVTLDGEFLGTMKTAFADHCELFDFFHAEIGENVDCVDNADLIGDCTWSDESGDHDCTLELA